jgi:hypothetical protein
MGIFNRGIILAKRQGERIKNSQRTGAEDSV